MSVRTLSIHSRFPGLPFCPNRSDKAINEVVSTRFRPRDGGRGQFGKWMAVGSFDLFGCHLRIRVGKLHPVVAETASHYFCIDHDVFLSSPCEDAESSVDWGGAETRLGGASVVLGDVVASPFLGKEGWDFGAGEL